MTDTPKDPEWAALEKGKNPKFGDIIENRTASISNPRRYGVFVRTGYKTGRINAGKFYECTDMQGNFWRINPDANLFVRMRGPSWIMRGALINTINKLNGETAQ